MEYSSIAYPINHYSTIATSSTQICKEKSSLACALTLVGCANEPTSEQTNGWVFQPVCLSFETMGPKVWSPLDWIDSGTGLPS